MKRALPWLLIAVLAGVFFWVVWKRLQPPPPGPPIASKPAPTPAPAPAPVALGGANERKTIDFSSGQPVVRNSAADQAAIEAALKDMAEATKSVTFDRPKQPAEPAPPKK